MKLLGLPFSLQRKYEKTSRDSMAVIICETKNNLPKHTRMTNDKSDLPIHCRCMVSFIFLVLIIDSVFTVLVFLEHVILFMLLWLFLVNFLIGF
jgi:uncharacterized protein YqhQ